MSFNAKAERARMLDASKTTDVNADMNQGSFTRTSPPAYPTDSMGQGKLGGFQGGNLGTFMNQAPSGGQI